MLGTFPLIDCRKFAKAKHLSTRLYGFEEDFHTFQFIILSKTDVFQGGFNLIPRSSFEQTKKKMTALTPHDALTQAIHEVYLLTIAYRENTCW